MANNNFITDNTVSQLSCPYCDKICKNKNSYRNHTRTCPKNEDRQLSPGRTGTAGKIKGNFRNAAMKAKDEGRTYHEPESKKKKMQKIASSRSKEWHLENGIRISKTVNEKVERGEWHTSLAKNMHHKYRGVDLHGKWELHYAKYLDDNGILWERCKTSFLYIFENKTRRYTPDFYLIESDEYIEIKGYKTNKDDAKWAQFPSDKKLSVLMKPELNKLGIRV